MTDLFRMAFVIAGTVVLAWLAASLLGVRQSLKRSAVAGLFGLIAGAIFAWNLSSGQPGLPPQPLVMLATTVIAAMLATTVLEVLFPNSSRSGQEQQGLTVPHPIQSIRRRIAIARRYSQILIIATRFGLASSLRSGRSESGVDGDQLTARRLRLALEEAGGIFIKLGQFLSTRPDIVSPALEAELSCLQDGVQPTPADQIVAVIKRQNQTEAFVEFDPAPSAVASIAQVHRATLTTGECVAVKVRRPGIDILVTRDLEIIRSLARKLERHSASARHLRLRELAEGFSRSLMEELDFRVEARNIEAARTALGPTSEVTLPSVHAGLVTAEMLVTGWLEGKKLREAQPLINECTLDRTSLARSLFAAILRQVMSEGIFHADPHPGNVLLLSNGSLALIDFGSVGRLDPLEVEAMHTILMAIRRRDAPLLREALLGLTQLRDEVNEELLERSLARFTAERLGFGAPVDAALFGDMFNLIRSFRLGFPPEIAAVFRCFVTLEGTLRLLDPAFNVADEVQHHDDGWIGEAFSKESLRKSIRDELGVVLPRLRRLPGRLDHIAADLDHGRLTINVRLLAGDREERLMERLVGRVSLVIFGPAIGVMSVVLLGIHGGPNLGGSMALNQILGYSGLCISVALILRGIVAVGWSSRTA